MIKLALPAGDLRPATSEHLAAAGFQIDGYGEGSRSYVFKATEPLALIARVFREKDIPVQVALGNYDLGICNLSWVAELNTRFRQRLVVPLRDLGIGGSTVFCAGADNGGIEDLGALAQVRIASDYPNLADAFARSARFRNYRLQTVWGAAEAYPPEDADCIITSMPNEEALRTAGLAPFARLLTGSAWLIGNPQSLARQDLRAVLPRLMVDARENPAVEVVALPPPVVPRSTTGQRRLVRNSLRMAVPDGHQQRHVVEALRAGGLLLTGYDEQTSVRRPESQLKGLEVKVIRPHDMPQLVAMGEMDIAITGRDCLMEHKYAFPSSPVDEIVDLRRGQYNLCAVVSEDLPASTIQEALDIWRSRGREALRIASEFPSTADHYARSRHFWRYQIIPIAGASEGFVPEDADLLIEGTETGRTLVENRLKAIDRLYRSTTCVIARRNAGRSNVQQKAFDEVLAALRRSAEAVATV